MNKEEELKNLLK